MATYQPHLDLIDVLDLLKDCGFPNKKWHDLGLRLGLKKNTLDEIEANHPGDASRCLTECISKWLSRADNVDRRGGATLDSLSYALKSIDEIAVVDKLHKKIRPHVVVTGIFNDHHPLLAQSLCDPIGVAWSLYEERIITREVVTRVESASPSLSKQREVLLNAISETIRIKPTSLQTFANVLCSISTNFSLGQAIKDDYSRHFLSTDDGSVTDNGSSQVQQLDSNAQQVIIDVPETLNVEYDAILSSYRNMFDNVQKVFDKKFSHKNIEELKDLISCCRSALRSKVEDCNSLSSVLRVVEEECSLTNIELLCSVVEDIPEVTEVLQHIEGYKAELKNYCDESSICLCLEKRFDFASHRDSELATYVFDWKPEEYKLKDITRILSEAVGRHMKIKIIMPDNSISVTCSFHSLMGFAIMKAIENVRILIRHGLKKLVIGNVIIWRRHDVREKELREKKSDALQDTEFISYNVLAKAEHGLNEAISSTKKIYKGESILLNAQTDAKLMKDVKEENSESLSEELALLMSHVSEYEKRNNGLADNLTKMPYWYSQSLLLSSHSNTVASRIIRAITMEINDLKIGMISNSFSTRETDQEIEELQEMISLISIRIMSKKEHIKTIIEEINETKEKIRRSSQPDAITSKDDPSGHNNSNKKSSAAIVPSEEYQDKLEQAQKSNKELNNGNLKKWISEGFVELTLTRVQMLGPPGSGKTCSQHLLLNEDPPLHKSLPLSSEAESELPSKSITDSTPIACRAVKAIRISCNDDKTLKRITRDDLLQKLASNLKNEGERRKREMNSAPTHPSGASRAGKSKQKLVVNSATNKSEGEQVSLLQASIGNAGKCTQERADAGKHTQEQADLAISENLNPSVPPPEEEVETSDVLEEIIKLIPQAKARQLTDEWVYIIDSGGQPAFQELLPLFTRAASLNVVTLDISKPLDEEYPYPYHVNGMLFNSDEELKYTNRKHFESSVLSGIFNQKPLDLQCVTAETPEHTMYFVLGTHYDEFEKMHAGNVEIKLSELNDELAESLPTSIRKKYVIYDRHKSIAHRESNIIIFPFNTLLPAKTDERDKASKLLSNAILKCSEVSLKMQVPIRWFVFELQLEGKAQSTEGLSFVTKKEAIEEGKKLKMNEAEVEEVLQYLHNCTIILYYPNVEPVQLVFVNPNRILEALSHLLILRFTDHVTAQSFAKSMTLKERHNIHEGIFEKSLLKKFTKVFSGQFQPEYFINLLKHLHIIAELPGHKYFLPCALPAYDIRDFKIPETTIKPLRFVWCIKENEWGPGYVPVPQGSFPLMIVFLLRQKECPVCFNKADGIKQFRDMVSFLISFKEDCEPMQKLYIVKRSKYIEVTYIGEPEHCPKLRDTIKTAINKSLKAINAADGYLYSAFACLRNEEHSCSVNEDMKTYCRESSDHDCPFDDNYRCWFDKASTSNGSEDTSIRADVAYKVMTEFAPRIKSCGIELNDLANKLLAKKIINHGKKEKVTDLRTGQTTSQRMDELLDAVMESVKVKATVFDYFLNILHEEDTIVTNALVEEMRKKYSHVLKSNTSK